MAVDGNGASAGPRCFRATPTDKRRASSDVAMTCAIMSYCITFVTTFIDLLFKKKYRFYMRYVSLFTVHTVYLSSVFANQYTDPLSSKFSLRLFDICLSKQINTRWYLLENR